MKIIIVTEDIPAPKPRKVCKLAKARQAVSCLEQRDVPAEAKDRAMKVLKNLNKELVNKPREQMTEKEIRIMLLVTPAMQQQQEYDDVPLHPEFLGGI
jgi:hypothetical protein